MYNTVCFSHSSSSRSSSSSSSSNISSRSRCSANALIALGMQMQDTVSKSMYMCVQHVAAAAHRVCITLSKQSDLGNACRSRYRQRGLSLVGRLPG